MTRPVVYLARDPDAQREVAIKLIKFGEDNAAMSRRLRKLFQTEDAIGRRLDHPNIVRIYDAVIEADQAYLVMEFIEGTALDQYCAINRLLPMPGDRDHLQVFVWRSTTRSGKASCIATSSRPTS